MSNMITDAEWNEAYNWFESNGYHVHDSEEGGFSFTNEVNGKRFYSQIDGWNLYKSLFI